jgi:LUD domain
MEMIQDVMKNLSARKIPSKYFKTKEELVEELLKEIPMDEVVAIGGSSTVESLDIYDELVKRGNDVLWHWKVEPEKRMELFKKALFSDVYLTSCNALTQDGKIINIDGNGNRVAAMFFGPKKVRVICGLNKIAKDYDDAMNRIKTVACPQNARRLERKTPCAVTENCSDCKSPDRMCTVTTIIEQKPPFVDFEVYILNENIGY